MNDARKNPPNLSETVPPAGAGADHPAPGPVVPIMNAGVEQLLSELVRELREAKDALELVAEWLPEESAKTPRHAAAKAAAALELFEQTASPSGLGA